MNIHWDSLLAVFLVSLGSAVAVVVLVAGLAILAVGHGGLPSERVR